MGSSKARSAVICKFSMGKPEILLLNAFTHHAPKQSSKCLVGDLSLAISLWMVGGSIEELGTKEAP